MSGITLNSIADFKKALTVGSKWKFRAHYTDGKDHIRTVTIKQTNAVAFTGIKDPSKSSWLNPFPKKNETIFFGGGIYIVDPVLRLSFMNSLNANGHLGKHIDPYLYYEPLRESCLMLVQ